MTVLITCMEKEFDKKLAEVFIREGYEVISGTNATKKPEKLDFLVDTTDYRPETDSGLNPDTIEQAFRKNVLAPMGLLEEYLPMLDKGEGKRLFYLTSAIASINETREKEKYAYNMSKAALHQFIQMVRNKLAPEGYTIRVFDPLFGELDTEAAAEAAFNYITRRRGTENHDPNRDDEATIVIRDANGRQHGW